MIIFTITAEKLVILSEWGYQHARIDVEASGYVESA